MKGLVGVLLGTCCAIVIACSSGAKSAATMPPSVARQPQEAARPHTTQADEIDALVAQIDQQRVEMNLPEQHGERQTGVEPHTSAMGGGTPVAPTAPSCKQPNGQSDNCKQSCTLKTSICENAKKICDIAGQMAGDAWAEQKCADGNATCDAAKKKCCECMP